jgi:ubiquinone/menaquinone biosynthesis C-methylase UbiE
MRRRRRSRRWRRASRRSRTISLRTRPRHTPAWRRRRGSLFPTRSSSIGQLWRRFLALAFRLLYNELAWTYDFVAWLVSLGQWKAWGRASLDYLHGSRVLELGHGPGHLLLEMSRRGLFAVGADSSTQMGRQARRRLAAQQEPSRLVRSRVQNLPFRDRAFDSAVATFPTEFIVDPAALREANRVLESPGRLVSIPVVRLAGGSLPARLLRLLYRATGQAESLPHSKRLGEAGFEPTCTWVPVKRAEVLLVVALK